MKKYYAYLQVKQDIRRWKRFGAEPAKQRAANVSLANNFVTYNLKALANFYLFF